MTHVPLVVVIAPDSFKGTLDAVRVAEAIAEGWRRARPDDELRLVPLADGGEGTLASLAAAGGWAWRTAKAHDPLMRPIRARWLQGAGAASETDTGVQAGTDAAGTDPRPTTDSDADADRPRTGAVAGVDAGTDRAVVELAAASGLSLVAPEDREALAATTFGTGEVLRAAMDAGARRIVLGIGGSATTDGGAGLLQALGARLVEIDGQSMFDGAPPVLLPELKTIDLSRLDPRLAEVDLRIACDVVNPLLGPNGAAAVYGPQKGADPERVAALEAALGGWADHLEAAAGRHERDTPGAGAAGGTGFGLLCIGDRFRSLELVPGVDLPAEAAGLDRALATADLVITGEGRIDDQTAFGKTALGVALRARAAGVRCVAIGGSVEPDGVAAMAAVGATTAAVHDRPVSLEEAVAAGTEPLVDAAERLARAMSDGGGPR
jgi:glycerate kinase